MASCPASFDSTTSVLLTECEQSTLIWLAWNSRNDPQRRCYERDGTPRCISLCLAKVYLKFPDPRLATHEALSLPCSLAVPHKRKLARAQIGTPGWCSVLPLIVRQLAYLAAIGAHDE